MVFLFYYLAVEYVNYRYEITANKEIERVSLVLELFVSIRRLLTDFEVSIIIVKHRFSIGIRYLCLAQVRRSFRNIPEKSYRENNIQVSLRGGCARNLIYKGL